MSRSSPRFKLCKSEKLPAFYFECVNSPDNCSSTYCPFCLSTSGSSLWHFRDAVHVLLLLNSVQWSLFVSLQLGSIRCLLVLVFSFLSVLLPDFPFPAFVLCQQTRGACGLPLWEPCVGKCHCFRQRRAWPHPDSRRSSDRHPLHMVPGPLRASVYCTLLRQWLVWQQVSNSLLICILGIKVKSGQWVWVTARLLPDRRQGSENSPVRRCWKAVLQLEPPGAASVSLWGA